MADMLFAFLCVCMCVSLQYLKMRLKYYKEIVSYLSKRAQIGKILFLNCRDFSCHLSLSLSLSLPVTTEARYHQDIAKLGKRTLLNLDDVGPEECLPLMEILKTSIDQVETQARNSENKAASITFADLLQMLLLLIY